MVCERGEGGPMEFSVNTTALPGLAKMLDRRHDDLVDCRDYISKNAQLGALDGGLIHQAAQAHRLIVAATEQFLMRAADERAGMYSVAVTGSVDYYNRTDASAAAALDVTYRQSDVGGNPTMSNRRANQSWGPEAFADLACSPGLPAPHDYRQDFTIVHSWMDALSPTTVARTYVWKASEILVMLGVLKAPYDILNSTVQPFVGDWSSFAACADVFATVATALDFETAGVNHGADVVHQVWTGNAADACQYALDVFGFDLRRSVDTFNQIAERYRACAETIKEQTEALDDLITVICDISIDILEAGVGAAPAIEWEEVGEIRRFVELVKKADGIVHTAMDAVAAFTHGLDGLNGSDGLGSADIGSLTLTAVADLPHPVDATPDLRVTVGHQSAY
jgi:hypothetical protein